MKDKYILTKQCDTIFRHTDNKVNLIILAKPILACKVPIKLAISCDNAAKLC